MPATQGNPNRLHEDKIMFGVSASMNVESENESTNDFRAGLEFAMLKNKLYLSAEMYYMNIGFTNRQKISDSYNYLGGYVQGGYFVAPRLQQHCAMILQPEWNRYKWLSEYACRRSKLFL